MNVPEAIQVSEKLSRAFDEGPSEDNIVFRVRPPTDSDGLQSSLDLFRSFYNVQTESGWFGENNVSNVCGFEIWYENESLKFVFIVPNEAENEHYRRQLAGHFKGIGIDDLVDNDEKFISIPEGDYVTSTRFSLRKHYFEPIGNPISGDGEVEHDPYQTILNEADTKDETRMVIQFLYKPAMKGWTRLGWNDVGRYADQLEEDGTSNPRLFGIKKDIVDNPQARQTGASNIKGRANKPGFHVEARMLVSNPDKAAAERQLEALVNLFRTTYLSPTEQTLVSDPPSNQQTLLSNMIQRREQRMGLPSGVGGYISAKWTGCSNVMVMTVPELAGLVHIPSDSDITVDGIDWANAPVKGTLPPDAKKFEPVTPEEVQALLTADDLREVAAHEPDLLHEFDDLVTAEHTNVEPIDPDRITDDGRLQKPTQPAGTEGDMPDESDSDSEEVTSQ